MRNISIYQNHLVLASKTTGNPNNQRYIKKKKEGEKKRTTLDTALKHLLNFIPIQL